MAINSEKLVRLLRDGDVMEPWIYKELKYCKENLMLVKTFP